MCCGNYSPPPPKHPLLPQKTKSPITMGRVIVLKCEQHKTKKREMALLSHLFQVQL